MVEYTYTGDVWYRHEKAEMKERKVNKLRRQFLAEADPGQTSFEEFNGGEKS